MLFMGKSTISMAMFNSKLLVHHGIPRKILGQPPAKPAEPAFGRLPTVSATQLRKVQETRGAYAPSGDFAHQKMGKIAVEPWKIVFFKHETLEKWWFDHENLWPVNIMVGIEWDKLRYKEI